MATFNRLHGESYRYCTLDPPVLREKRWVRESKDESGPGALTPRHVAEANVVESQHHGSRAQTPSPIAKVSQALDESQHDCSGSMTPRRVDKANEDLKITLQRLGAEVFEKYRDFNIGHPPGLRTPTTKNRLHQNLGDEVVSMNLTQPLGAASSSMPPWPPHLHTEPMFVRQGQDAVTKTESVKPLMEEQVVSEDAVGLPLGCVEVYKSAKQKICSQQELFAKVGSEDARLKEARSVAAKLVSLLGGADPFANKAKDNRVVAPEVSAGTMGSLGSCRSFGQEARSSSSGALHYSAAARDLQATDVGDGPSGASYSAVAQGVQGSIANGLLVSSFDELTTVPLVCSHRGGGTNQEELPGRQASPQEFPLVVSIGSICHPHSCGPPCKFTTSAKGCKDGRLCSHCHICHWSRYNARTCNKQPREITGWMGV